MSRTTSSVLMEREFSRLHRRIMLGLDSLAKTSDEVSEAAKYLREVAVEYTQNGGEEKVGE